MPDGRIALDPSAFGGYNYRHHPESTAADRYGFMSIGRCDIASLAGKAADRMGKVPEIAKGLFLYQVQQGAVAKLAGFGFFLNRRLYSLAKRKTGNQRQGNRESSFFQRQEKHVFNSVACFEIQDFSSRF